MAKGRVLLVDADRKLLSAMATGLRGAGYDVQTATTAVEAAAIIDRERLDVVVTEIDLTDGEGHALAARVRERGGASAAAVVYLSVRAREEDFERAQKLGVARFIAKPCQLAVLIVAVDSLLETRAEAGRT